MKYRAFADEVRKQGIVIDEFGNRVTFVLPMPKSWSKKKKIKMLGKPHQTTPDKDNLEKGLLDAIFKNDSHIWDLRVTKVWGEVGMIIVEESI